MPRIPAVLMLVAALVLSAHAPASDDDAGRDWPQWRGPARDGVSLESSWDPTGTPEPLWRADLGLGHSSFAVADGRVYTLGYDMEAGLDRVFCLDAATGAEQWRHEYPAEPWDSAHDGGALTTPTVVGDVVYTSNREGRLFCFDVADGTVRWARELAADHELEPHTWGFSASPLVVGDFIYMNLGRLVCVDRHTGADAWLTERSYGNPYSTPAPFDHDGKACLAVLGGDGVAVIGQERGSEIAFYPWVKNPQIYPMTPVVIDDRIFVSAGYNRGCVMLQLTDDGLEELWAGRVMRNKMTGSVLWEDHLYGFDESILKCIDLDGNEKWRQRGMGTGSMSVAGGRLLILDGKGQIIVAEASPDAYVELSRREVFEAGTGWSTPVLSHGRVYARSSLGPMVCLDYRGTSSAGAPTTDLARTTGAGAAAAGDDTAAALPDAASLVTRHVEAVDGPAAIDRLRTVQLRGTTESLVNTVREGTVELAWSAQDGFAWSEDTGLRWGHDGAVGWHDGLRSRPRPLEGAELDEIREAGSIRRLLDPGAFYTNLRTIRRTVFDNRDCWAVAATSPAGHARTLYFEVDSGLYAGHDGEGIHMWTVSDYRPFDGVALPAQWSFYEPVKGEMLTARFESGSINDEVPAETFEVPETVQKFMLTPEQIAAANERLSKVHADILGTWQADADPPRPPTTFEVRDGFLKMSSGDDDEDPDFMTEPDDDGVFAIISAEFVTFTPERNDKGVIEAITVRVGPNPMMRLVREKG